MNDWLIIVIGLAIAVLLIYLKQQYITKPKNERSYVRHPYNTKDQKTSQQLSTSQPIPQKIENNKVQDQKQTLDRQSPQKVSQLSVEQNNKVKSRVLSLDLKQNQSTIGQKDSSGFKVKFKDDYQESRIQHRVHRAEWINIENQPSQYSSDEFLMSNFRPSYSQERQRPDQAAAPIRNQNQSQITNNGVIVQQKIFNLYNISCRIRNSDAKFLGSAILSKNYNDLFIDKDTKSQLNLFLKGYRQVRGDGNCYFTSIAFQYFEILLQKFSQQEFEEFMAQIRNMPFQIQYGDYFIEDFYQSMCAERLVQLLQGLRNRPQDLEYMMADPNQEFYGLAIIFFRNLAQFLYIQYNSQIINEYKPDLSNELLTWEFQCNDSEMINSSLAKIINVYLIDQRKSEVTQLNYGQSKKYQIHLIYIPGHYDIGIPV
ncbi:unnamed protein product (macronuclear) [Paramecium tetraurelia]|uniref:ubiquitinyl hydrolase 1 n=1 Tax=Paramecium tetraurelia TaxID=5888 RepID=A0CL95_PARTE|nr:uncharacterized protein GSPATT00008109001 [Paramecium tetraurelia]CAK71562.1 unnamed protein product [Paramecium tetraurelia]|eukprot:XP_001438959.1 hypothetical protein (macronuclear) [Paramecium tetraurelia strain d4-2]